MKLIKHNSSIQRHFYARIISNTETYMQEIFWTKKEISRKYKNHQERFAGFWQSYFLFDFAEYPSKARCPWPTACISQKITAYTNFPCSNATTLQGFLVKMVVGHNCPFPITNYQHLLLKIEKLYCIYDNLPYS